MGPAGEWEWCAEDRTLTPIQGPPPLREKKETQAKHESQGLGNTVEGGRVQGFATDIQSSSSLPGPGTVQGNPPLVSSGECGGVKL